MGGNPLINDQHLKNAANARPLTAISFHFVPGRLGYLSQVLRSLAAFPVPKRDIRVFTNTTDAAEQSSILDVIRQAGLVEGSEARLVVESALAHPYNLTWAHKRIISGDFLAPENFYSHFIYLEDDMRLTFDNFAYFLAAREVLRPFDHLLPGFLRTEWSAPRGCAVSTDCRAPIHLSRRPFIAHGDYAFIGLDNPYYAGFILDQDLAREYVKSPSFDLDRSRKTGADAAGFGVRERAAMGLTFENPPRPFLNRMVAPVSISSRAAPPCIWMAHLPNNYANDPATPFGKLAMTDVFAGQLTAENEVTLASFQSPAQTLSRFSIRVAKKVGARCVWWKRDAQERLGEFRREYLRARDPKGP